MGASCGVSPFNYETYEKKKTKRKALNSTLLRKIQSHIYRLFNLYQIHVIHKHLNKLLCRRLCTYGSTGTC